jgi:hypothetical protein
VVDELKDNTGNIEFAAEVSVDAWNDDNNEELEHEPHSEAYSELLQHSDHSIYSFRFL